jgi:hypothetical protein
MFGMTPYTTAVQGMIRAVRTALESHTRFRAI